MNQSKLFIIILFISGCITSCNQETGQIFEELDIPSGWGSGESSWVQRNDGVVSLSWIERDSLDNSALVWSTLEGSDFSNIDTIASGRDWFVNWADFPDVIRLKNGAFLAHYLQKSADDTYAYDVMVTSSTDKGKSWGNAFKLHADSTKTEHGFVSKLNMGDVGLLAWLDGRKYAQPLPEGQGFVEQMSLRSAILGPGGNISTRHEIDARVCDCCQTDMAMTPNGPMIVYRDRSEAEIRDIYFSIFRDGKWTEPAAVFDDNWLIEGCPVNGPVITSNGNNTAVAWFSSANRAQQVKLAFYDLSKNKFDQPVLVDDTKSLGRLDLVFIDEETVVISWLDMSETNSKINLQAFRRDGTRSEIISPVITSESRSSGFPRMIISGSNLYLSWTEAGQKTRVRAGKIDLKNFLSF